MNNEEIRKIFIDANLSYKNEKIKIIESTGGIINSVYKIEVEKGIYFLKQAHINPSFSEKISINPNRINIERRAIQEIIELLGQDWVPQIVYYNDSNYFMITKSAPNNAILLREDLLKGKVDFELAKKLGIFLKTMHQKTLKDIRLETNFSDLSIITNLKLPIFYYPLLKNVLFKPIIRNLIEDIQNTKICLVHGDFNPKNILVWNEHVNIIDWEQCHYGDPRGELGGFLAHYIIKGIHNYHKVNDYIDALAVILSAYNTNLSDLDMKKIKHHIAVYLLGRVDSVAKAFYLKDKGTKEKIRYLANELFLEENNENLIDFIRCKLKC
jgi:5-methylthioribose kinase